MNASSFMGFGVGMVILGGLMQGGFAVPMKHMRAWRWENVWLVYSVVGLLVFPWLLVWATVPGSWEILHQASGMTLAEIALFGFGWGVGAVLFGLGINRVGLALTFAIVPGMSAALGSLLPLLVMHPRYIFTRQGYYFLAGLALVLVGIAVCAFAGHRRDRKSKEPSDRSGRSSFWVGLLICVLSGIFSSMLNFSFAFGKSLQQLTLAAGARTAMASNLIWALALTAGFVVNAGYCVFLLQRNRTWNNFLYQRKSALLYWGGAAVMGILWFGGLAAYGVGASALGSMGAVVGWPVFMAIMIIAGNVFGAVSGEWKGSGRATHAYTWLGIVVLVAAIYVISRGSS